MSDLFLPFFAYAALVLAVLWFAAKVCDWLEESAPEHDPHAELHCLDDDLDAEWEQRWRAGAARRRGQDLPPIESIGGASLDEIRRRYGGGAA